MGTKPLSNPLMKSMCEEEDDLASSIVVDFTEQTPNLQEFHT